MKKTFKKILGLIANIFFWLLLFLPLSLFNLFYKIRFYELVYNRIGHLTSNTEVFLRSLQLGMIKDDPALRFFFSGPPANKAMLDLYRRQIRVVDHPLLIRFFLLIRPSLEKTPFLGELPMTNVEFKQWSLGKKSLSFSSLDHEKAKVELEKMGIGPNDWWVCFHSRDSAYMQSYYDQNDMKGVSTTNYQYRDTSIENYLPAAEFITQMGGYAVRIGFPADNPLETKNKKIIDYSFRYRSDFMDVYLSANCRFFIGNTSGLFVITSAFDIPVAGANFIPLPHTPLAHRDLFIPKILKDKKTGEILSYQRCRERGLLGWLEDNQFYIDQGIEILENSGEDILELTKEMYEQIQSPNGKFEDSPEQLIYKEKILKETPGFGEDYKYSARIANSFVRNHKHLFEGLL